MKRDRSEPFFIPAIGSDRQSQIFSEDFIHELTALVARHPRVTRTFLNNPAPFESKREMVDEVVQEMVVRILSSPALRGMTDEQQLLSRIRNIELPQLFNEVLRKKMPERFRLSKRIWKIIRESERLTVFSTSSSEPIYDASNLIGLSEWTEVRNPDIESIQSRMPSAPLRDSRAVGRSGESQLIMSNSQLESFLVGILESVGGHLALGRLKGIALSCIYLCDPGFESLEQIDNESGRRQINSHITDPQEELIRKEQLARLPEKELEFLRKLEEGCGRNKVRFKRVLGVLRLCVLSNPPLQKRYAARLLQVSTSLISRDISLIRGACRSLELHDEEQKLLLKERLEKTIGGEV
jgi:hypothetical protein